MGGTNTGSTVLNWLVGDGELSKVVANHLGSDFNLIEELAVVNSNDRSDHLRNNDHASKMSLDWGRLLTGCTFFLALGKFFQQSFLLGSESLGESPSDSSCEELAKLLTKVS